MSAEDHVSIEGTLLMLDDSTPHVAVPVQAIRDGAVIATTLSDEHGRYQFINLKQSRYQLRCQVLNGYVYYEKEGNGRKCDYEEARRQGDEVTPSLGDYLEIEVGGTLSNIDFRFAPFKKGTWKTYTYLDGLASNYVHDIHSDPDGVVWFAAASSGGVSRYDGKEFVNFTAEDGLANSEVFAIHGDPDGTLWFGTGSSFREGAGVSRYDGREFVTLTTEDGLAGNNVYVIHRDPDGVMWFGTSGDGVSRYDGKEFINFTTEDGLVNNYVNAIHGDSSGVMWFGTNGGVSRYDGKQFVNLTTKDGLANDYVNAIHGAPDGVVWFGTFGGVSRYDGRKFVNLTTEDGLASNLINAIYGDLNGVLWFGTGTIGATEGNGVSRYDGKTFVNFTAQDGLGGNSVLAIHGDSNGLMWFSIHGGGVSRYDSKTFVSFDTKDGLAGKWIRSTHIDPDGVMWFGTHADGISRYDGNVFTNFTTKDGLASNRVNSICHDRDGVVWFGTGSAGGVSRYDEKDFVNFTTEDGLAGNYVWAVYGAPDGVMWFGTHGGGVSRYDGEEFVNLTTKDGLAHGRIRAIYGAPDGVMWFGVYGGGVSRCDGVGFVNITTEDGLISNDVNVIYCDPDGVMWFGTVSGISQYNGKEFISFTTKDGLANNTVISLHRSPDGVMWFGTQGGVSGYDGVAWTSLDTRDGLAGNGVHAIHQDSDGFLWFGTRAGITRYRGDDLSPKVYIASVTTDQTYRDLSAIPAFTPGTRVTIEYSSTDLKTIPEKRQYRCRIMEIDSDWSKPTKATSLDYTFDKPGIYTFEVQAIDRDLNYSETASVKLEVIPDPRNHRIIQLEAHIHEQELAELERVHQELEDARHIQQSLLPEKPPEIEGFEIAGISNPAREVSGDFYSYLSLGDNTGIVLADVTGKSVKAAMVAAMTNGMLQSKVKARSELWNSPSKILNELNTGLQPHLIRGMYTAMSLAIIQPTGKRLILSNAGMPYPIVKRGKEVWELEVTGMPLGLVDSAEYEDLGINLKVGDLIIFCSDGVIEAVNEADEMYQTERLLEVVKKADTNVSAHDMLDLIVDDVAEFVGNMEPSDDMTVVVLRFSG